jgi:poly-gamma-glutamate synthase PgsB/CapB
MLFILLLVLLFVGFGFAEYSLHRRNLARIPVRIQVNGTRGKSSVTRLIAAGLRAGGMRVAAKVTGTNPRFILTDTEEHPVRRLGKANILEELRIVRLANRHKAQALVIECMALVPEYQRTENRMLIRPTHGVITNVRADHLDVMGPTVTDVGKALSNTIPRRGRFFTAERGHQLQTLQKRVPRETTMTVTDPTTIRDDEMTGFSYIEHKENVALALAVCDSLGVEREHALAGMQRSLPDSGVMRLIRVEDKGKVVELVNTLAANDPDSIGMLWRMVKGRSDERIVLVNCRRDRADRSRQLAELVAGWECSHIVATGGLPRVFIHRALELGVPKAKLTDLGEERPPAEVYERVFELVRSGSGRDPIRNRSCPSLLFATGNTVGYGDSLIAYFEERRTKNEERNGS